MGLEEVLLAVLFMAAGATVGWLVGRRSTEAARSQDRVEGERRLSAEREGLAQQRERTAAAERERDARATDLQSAQAELVATRAQSGEARSALAGAQAESAGHARRAEEAFVRLREAEATVAAQASELRDRGAALEGLQARMHSEAAAAADKLRLLTEAEEKLADRFKVLAAEIFGEKAKTFRVESQTSLEGLLAPLREKLGDFHTKVDALQKEGVESRVELRTQIENLRTMNERLSSDANNLAKALKNSSKQQGDWGEVLLIGMLEEAGLRANHEYRVQESFATEDGRQARPDIILNLPDDKHLVIDSKVSLSSYAEYCACEDEGTRRDFLERHARSLRDHIDGLSRKSYQALHQLRSLDFVVMFVPIEPAYLLALAHDGGLWQRAWKKDVLLVSPGTLFPVIRTIAHIWQQDRQTRNTEEIVRQGSDLYDKLALFAATFEDVGKKLGSAQTAFDKAYGQLASGKGNIVGRVERMRKLGLRKSKNIPAGMLGAGDLLEEAAETADLRLLAEDAETER